MEKVTFTDFFKLKIENVENIGSFITLCDKYTSQSDLEDVCTSYMLSKFYEAADFLARQIEQLHNDFIPNGFPEDVENLRNKANQINDTALKLLQVINRIPYEFSSKNENLQTIENACSVWARYAVAAEKLVSEDIASIGLLSKDKFIKLVDPSNAHIIEEIYEEQINLFNKSTKATLDNLTVHGRKDQAKLIDDVYNHRSIFIPIKKNIKKTSKEGTVKDSTRTRVSLINKNKLWLLLPAFIAPFIGFFLYDTWWMFFCVILVAAIQLFPWGFLSDIDMVEETITVDELDEYVNSETRIDLTMRICFVIIAVLNSFPFLSSSKSFLESIRGYGVEPYEGGLLVTLITILLIVAWIFSAFAMKKPSILENKNLFDSTGKTVEQKREEDRQETLRQTEIKVQQMTKKYGVGFVSLGSNVFANENTQKLYVNSKEIDFKDILDFSVQDNAVTIHSEATSTAKTNTGSMLGRAVVGGALFGNAGAIIGGATAKKTIEHSASQSSIVHDYKVIITVNSISSPNVTIKVGKDENSLNKIVSTLGIFS